MLGRTTWRCYAKTDESITRQLCRSLMLTGTLLPVAAQRQHAGDEKYELALQNDFSVSEVIDFGFVETKFSQNLCGMFP
jgi:hypothetical protein